MNVRIFETLRARTSWTLANNLLKRAGLAGAQGWDDAITKNTSKIDSNAEERLLEHLRQSALCSNKLSKFYRLEHEQISKLRIALEGLEVEKSKYSEVFPCALSETELGTENAVPKLVSIERTEEGVGIVYASVIKLTVKEDIPISDDFRNPDLIQSKYDEIIGLKYKAIQTFNVIWIPHHDNLIEIRTDFPNGMSNTLAHEIQSQFKAMVQNLTMQKLDIGQPIDLSQLIEKMYENHEEGTVVELSFKTSTASIKNEKMRRTPTCLRNELYHKGGKDALGTKIDPFKISIRWYFTIDGHDFSPELTLAGSSRGQLSANGKTNGQIVTGAVIQNCSGVIDYEFVKERIKNYLK